MRRITKRLIRILRRAPHEILGVASNASPDEIKRAYRKLAIQHHPDRDKSPGAEERMKEINGAYDRMKDGNYTGGSYSSSGRDRYSSSHYSRGDGQRSNSRRQRNYQPGRRCPICQINHQTKGCPGCYNEEKIFDFNTWRRDDSGKFIKYYGSIRVRALVETNRRQDAEVWITSAIASTTSAPDVKVKFKRFRLRKNFRTAEEAAHAIHNEIIEFARNLV